MGSASFKKSLLHRPGDTLKVVGSELSLCGALRALAMT